MKPDSDNPFDDDKNETPSDSKLKNEQQSSKHSSNKPEKQSEQHLRPPIRIDTEYEDEDDEYERRSQPQNFDVHPGTYLFSIGPIGSGKSTFQSQLIRYLVQSNKFSIDPIWTDDAMSLEAEVLLKTWRDDWENYVFPQTTLIRNPAVLRFNVKALEYPVRPIKFGIIEVSGEDYNRLVNPAYGIERKLPDILEAYLSHPKVNLIFAFVCKGGDPTGADRLFSSMINHLKRRNPKFSERGHSLIVISDPHTAKRYMELQGHVPNRGYFQLDPYIQNYLPDSSTKLLEWKKRYRPGQFYVGRVVPGDKITKYDNTDAEDFITWIYEKISKQRLQNPYWRRLIENIIDNED